MFILFFQNIRWNIIRDGKYAIKKNHILDKICVFTIGIFYLFIKICSYLGKTLKYAFICQKLAKKSLFMISLDIISLIPNYLYIDSKPVSQIILWKISILL